MKPLLLVPVLCLSLVGCAFMGRVKDAATTPDPLTGVTPIQTVATNAPAVIANPLNIPAWLQIVGAIAGVVVTAAGGYSIKQRRDQVDATLTLVDLKEEQMEAMRGKVA